MVPDVSNCSKIIIRRFVITSTFTPRFNADIKASMTGRDVKFGVISLMDLEAVAKR